MIFEAGTPDEAWGHGRAAVVCHDAGAAAHAFAWLAGKPRREAVVYAEGPAARIATTHGLRLADSLERALASADWALVGTGWQSNLEKRAMQVCAALHISCVAIVDHWVNYPNRFRGLRIHELPRHVVVTDSAAEDLARQQLVWATVARWPNDQATAFVRRVRAFQDRGGLDQPYLLWLQEPIRDADGRVRDPLTDPRYASRAWDLIAKEADKRSIQRVIVRMHPSQRPLTYNTGTVIVEVRDPHKSTLTNDVSGAAMCLGINSYALYLAAKAGVETASVAHALGLKSLIPAGLVPAFA